MGGWARRLQGETVIRGTGRGIETATRGGRLRQRGLESRPASGLRSSSRLGSGHDRDRGPRRETSRGALCRRVYRRAARRRHKGTRGGVGWRGELLPPPKRAPGPAGGPAHWVRAKPLGLRRPERAPFPGPAGGPDAGRGRPRQGLPAPGACGAGRLPRAGRALRGALDGAAAGGPGARGRGAGRATRGPSIDRIDSPRGPACAAAPLRAEDSPDGLAVYRTGGRGRDRHR